MQGWNEPGVLTLLKTLISLAPTLTTVQEDPFQRNIIAYTKTSMGYWFVIHHGNKTISNRDDKFLEE